jgi:tetratricopeptide (TPR) repeat protein
MTAEWKVRIMVVGFLLLFACRPAVIVPPPETVPSSPERPAPTPSVPSSPDAVEKELNSREQVAAALTDQGRGLLNTGRVDGAIRVFEQAVSQSPHYGPAYFYLAEAWRAKNNGPQARAFHDQATLYLQGQPEWASRLERQQIEIDRTVSGLSLP